MGRNKRAAAPQKFIRMAQAGNSLVSNAPSVGSSMGFALAGGAAGALTVGLVALVAGRFGRSARRNKVDVASPANVLTKTPSSMTSGFSN